MMTVVASIRNREANRLALSDLWKIGTEHRTDIGIMIQESEYNKQGKWEVVQTVIRYCTTDVGEIQVQIYENETSTLRSMLACQRSMDDGQEQGREE